MCYLILGVAMENLGQKFTDHHLMLFYGNVLQHYQVCCGRYGEDEIAAIHHEMITAVQYALESQYGALRNYSQQEKSKVYKAFHAIFEALPVFHRQSIQGQNLFKSEIPPFKEEEIKKEEKTIIKKYYGKSHLVDWMVLNAMMHHCYHDCHYPDGERRSDNEHKHGDNNNRNKTDLTEVFALLAVILLAAVAAVLACVALYYMLNEFLEGIDRFCYNEGWLKAALIMANSIVFGASSTILTVVFASTPLASLAILAGISPVGFIVTGAIFLGIIGSGLGAFAMNLLYSSVVLGLNQDAMDPTDPFRFRLTASEEESLIKKDIDPIVVKCAMVALRAEIAETLGSNDKAIPSFLHRKFGAGAKVQDLLTQVRALRDGSATRVEVGALVFECKTPVIVPSAPPISSSQY